MKTSSLRWSNRGCLARWGELGQRLGKQDAEGVENRGFADAVDADDQVHTGLKGDFDMVESTDVGEGEVAELHGLSGNLELPGDSGGD